MTEKEFSEYFTLICELYNTAPSKALVEMYYRALGGFDNSRWKTGVEKMIKERKERHFPLPGEIKEWIEGSKKNRAMLARDKLRHAMRNYGAYRTVIFDDPIIHKIIQNLGGWIAANKMEIKELDNYMKYDFEKVYTAYTETKVTNIPLVFHGINDLANKIDSIENVIYCGEKKDALTWIMAYEDKYLADNTENKLVSTLKSIGVEERVR